MATKTFPMGLTPGVTVYLTYNDATNFASSLNCDNASGHAIYAQATLTDGTGRVYGQTFQPGSTFVNFPNNVVTVVPDDHEPGSVHLGNAYVTVRDPA